MINSWLELPAVAMSATLVVFYAATAALMAWLAFRSPVGP